MNIKEWFKSKPYWLKVGVILSSIYCSLFLLGIILSPLSAINSAVEEIVVALIIVISIPSIWVMALFPGLSYTEGIGWEFFIGAIITYFLVGAIIGWIYEKIRSKK